MKKAFVGLVALFLTLNAAFSSHAQKKIEIASRTKTAIKPARVESVSVKFGKIEAYSDGRGVWLEWEAAAEKNNLGFTVNRLATGKNGASENVSRRLIPGAYLELGATDAANRKYSYFDADGDLNSVYAIGTLSLNGERSSSSHIRPQPVTDLTGIAGASSDDLRASATSAARAADIEAKILPADASQTDTAQPETAASDPAQQLWVAAQPGVKIGVRQDGLYRVTRAELQAAGFDVNAPVNLWQLYSNGVQQSIIVEPGGAYIEFYGRAIDTPEANTQIYYLLVGGSNGKRISSNRRNVFVEGRITIGTFAQSLLKKERLNYSSNVLNGDDENFFGSVVTNSGAGINLNLTGVNFTAANVSIDVTLQGLTTTPHQTRIVLNGHQLGLLDGSQRDSSTAHFEFPSSYLNEGSNSLQLTSLLGSGDISYFDRLKLNFQRKFKAEQNSLLFYLNSPRVTYADNFASANIRVFDVTNPEAPVLLTGLPVEQNGGSYRVYIQKNRVSRRGSETVGGNALYAVEDSAILPAATVTSNQPSTLTTTNHNADLLIVTYKNWATQANDWADYRRAQGLSVEVVNIEDIFDEQSFGAVSSSAIKSFLQYAAGNWQTAPRYVLLIGDATYDPKNYFGAGYNSYIPSRFVDTVYTETPSDDALADFNDDGLAEVAIGRIPAKSAAYVTQQLNKTSAFEQALAANGLNQRGALFASDAPNGYDFQSLSERVRQQLPQDVPATAVNKLDANANANLISQMNASKFVINYSGHGSTADWASDSAFFGKARVAELTNSNLSIFTMLTCLNGYFVNPNQSSAGDGLAETLLVSPNGAVAVWASTGLTTPDVQEIMATRFYQQFGAGTMTRLGDLVKDAKTEITYGRDVRLSWVLLGDPTLKVR